MMMQTADFRQLPDRPQLRRLHWARGGGVHVEGTVNAPGVIIVHVGSKYTAQMRLIQHDDLIQALTPHAADEPLALGILPRRTGRDLHFFNAQVADSLLECGAVDRVPIS